MCLSAGNVEKFTRELVLKIVRNTRRKDHTTNGAITKKA
jgi:hypothetical protein